MEVGIERMGGDMDHELYSAVKTLHEVPNGRYEWPLPCPTWMRISLSRNWLTNKVSEYSSCNGQASAFQNVKGKLSIDQNPFSFLMTYFYNPSKVLQGRIHSHWLPPTHP